MIFIESIPKILGDRTKKACYTKDEKGYKDKQINKGLNEFTRILITCLL